MPRAIYEAVKLAPESSELRVRVHDLLDAGVGNCALRNPALAGLVEKALTHFDGDRYRLLAWAVMPNHVHVLFEPAERFRLGDIVGSWKSFTAKAANALSGGSGRFWAPDYFDRFVRDEAHLRRVLRYIEENPVKAGLVGRAEEWPFSSARFKR